MRELLDRIFSNRRAAIIVPLITAAVMYLLFVLFGQGADKKELLLTVPIISAIWYGAMFFALWLVSRVPACPAWVLDVMELVALAVYGYGAVSQGAQFFVNMALNFEPSLCTSVISWSAIALVHDKRE